MLAASSKPVGDNPITGAVRFINDAYINPFTGMMDLDDDKHVPESSDESMKIYYYEPTGPVPRANHFPATGTSALPDEKPSTGKDTVPVNFEALGQEIVTAFNNNEGTPKESIERMIKLIEKEVEVDRRSSRVATVVLELLLDTLAQELESTFHAGAPKVTEAQKKKLADLIRVWNDVLCCINSTEFRKIQCALQTKINQLNQTLKGRPMYQQIWEAIEVVLKMPNKENSKTDSNTKVFQLLCSAEGLFQKVQDILTRDDKSFTKKGGVEAVKLVLLNIVVLLNVGREPKQKINYINEVKKVREENNKRW